MLHAAASRPPPDEPVSEPVDTPRDATSRVMVVDDDPVVLASVRRMLERAGYRVIPMTTAEAAMEAFDRESVDVLLSDEQLPGMSGSALLHGLRQRGIDVPFVLMTGNPSLEKVLEAFEHGALRYLTKPVAPPKLLSAVERGAKLRRLSLLQREASRVTAPDAEAEALSASLDRALESAHLAFQPIASTALRSTTGFEALLRTREPTLPHPGAILDAAERLGRLWDVGRRVRELAGDAFAGAPDGALLFINLHPTDLLDPLLFEPSRLDPSRVVLEITERADVRRVTDLGLRLRRLRETGFRLAVDDLGSGFAGLTSVAEMDPEFIKLDMSLVRNLHADPTRHRIVESLVRLCRDLGRAVVGEGVEERQELEALRALGCELVQGYLLARPGPPFPEVSW